MKITESRPLNQVRSVRRYETLEDSSGAASTLRDITDSAAVMGIPAEEMTPKVRTAIMQLMQEVDRARRDLETAQRKIADLEKLADQDPMTNLANRRAFVREMGRMISFAARYEIPTSLIYFDVNDLKAINDTHGHNVGDAALNHISDLLQKNIRESDIVGRLGGDEFAVILPNANEDNAQTKASALAKIIADTPLVHGDLLIPVRVAYGAYSFNPDVDPSQALAEADRKMYAHKRALKSGLI